MKALGCLGFYSCYIKNLLVDSQPFYDLIKDSTYFHWTDEHERIFQSIKDRISEDTILAVPSTEYSFHSHVDSPNVGTGSILIQQFPEGKRIISFNSRVFDKAEQKMSTIHREIWGIVSTLQTYEHYIIGSPFPIYLYCDHKPILYLWGRIGQLSHRFFCYPVIITKFQNLKIIWTPGSNLAFPDFLSRNVTLEGYQKHQLQQKCPETLSSLRKIVTRYFIKSNTKTTHTTLVMTRLQNDGESYTLNSISNEFPTLSVHSAADCFRMGKTINQLRRLCFPLSYSPILHDTSDPTYSSISSLYTDGDGCETLNIVTVPTDRTEDDEEEEEDDHIFTIDTNIDHYRLCKAKQLMSLFSGKSMPHELKNH